MVCQTGMPRAFSKLLGRGVPVFYFETECGMKMRAARPKNRQKIDKRKK